MSNLPVRRFAEVRWLFGVVILLLILGTLLPLLGLVFALGVGREEPDPLLASAAAVAAALQGEGAVAQPGVVRLAVYAGTTPLLRVGSVPSEPYWPFPSQKAWEAAGRPAAAFGVWNGERLRVVFWPLRDGKLLQLFAPQPPPTTSPWLAVTVGLSLLLSLSGGALAWYLVGQVLAPYGELLEEARSFAGKAGEAPEDRFLVSTFRQAVQRVEQQERELSSRAQELAELSAGLAHELRNHLAVMDGYVRLARENPQELSRYLEILAGELRSQRDFLERFLAFVRPENLSPAPVALGKVLRELAARLAAQYPEVAVEVEGEGVAWADPTAVRVVLENLLRNACEAARKPGGWVKVTVEQQARQVLVQVADNGPGVSPELVGQLFQPFVSAKPGGGIGLALARRLARACGGEVELAAAAGPTVFVCRLPRERQA